MNSEGLDIGLCGDPRKIARRLKVSGLRLLTEPEAVDAGYRPGFRAIVPTVPRQPSSEEVAAFTATPETPHKMWLIDMAQQLGKAVRDCPWESSDPLPNLMEYTEIAPNIQGVPLAVRYDKGGNLTTSIDWESHNEKTNRPGFVGMHIDQWSPEEADADITYGIVVRGGEGVRYHMVCPEVNQKAIGGKTNEEATDYVSFLLDRGHTPRVYWIEMRAPHPRRSLINGKAQSLRTPWVTEALLGSPVAEYLHDGSTLPVFAGLGSTAMMMYLRDFDAAQYPSLLAA